uniref:Uncharacterized protein n=1 Tax=Anguilla anguilla TaxID=7936 RepID=A0A0E9R8I0_ANGAN
MITYLTTSKEISFIFNFNKK